MEDNTMKNSKKNVVITGKMMMNSPSSKRVLQ